MDEPLGRELPGPPKQPELRIQWVNLFSMRFWYATLIGGAVLGFIPLGLIAWAAPWFTFDDIPPFIVYGVVGFAILLAGLTGLLGHALYCPACGKRVKAGASVCHHCGHNQEVEVA